MRNRTIIRNAFTEFRNSSVFFIHAHEASDEGMTVMNTQMIVIEEQGLHMVFRISETGDVTLLHIGASPLQANAISAKAASSYRMLELQLSGEDRAEYHGRSHRASFPGLRLTYQAHEDVRNEQGRKLEFTLVDAETAITVKQHYQFVAGLKTVRSWTTVNNTGAAPVAIEYVSSFAFTGFGKEGKLDRSDKMKLYIAHSGWQSELQWKSYRLPELGLNHLADRGSKRLAYSNTGSWSCAEVVPMAVLEDTENNEALYWQIEHNGSWHWELTDQADQLMLLAGGPNEHDNHWWEELEPGESFTSVPVSFGVASGGFEESVAELTHYRRAIRRKNEDNELLRIIFNDYMNCLWGSPTTDKLLPLIDAASEVGCEYFCIDAGWYAPGEWWDGVGQWLPSSERFPQGIKFVLDYIRSKGMIPGLWLEIEVMGIHSPKLAEADDSWFFMRHGKRVKDRSRYQLDFRSPKVIAHANEVIARLVEEYGVGYIKMDYNINAGIGTETNADSVGAGLLEHNRAYLSWLDSIFAKYPELVIENCSSGGMRMDYAMLSRYSIQSTSDQEDYVNYATIAAGAPAVLAPEQAAVWSYPLREGDDEEVVFNMINALLLRVHQSGHLAELSKPRLALVKEALDYYKTIRMDIKESTPFWPLGPPDDQSEWVSVGLKHKDRSFIAVWRVRGDSEQVVLPLTGRDVHHSRFEIAYPKQHSSELSWNAELQQLTIKMPQGRVARLIEIN